MKIKVLSLFCVCFFIVHCSSSKNEITVSTNVDTDSVISTSQKLIVTFSDSMDASAFTLSGTMVENSDGGVWSTTENENDTFTLSPDPFWDASKPGDVTISTTDTEGESLEPIAFSFVINLALSNFQASSVVIGQTDFTGSDNNQGSSDPAANSLNSPYGNPAFVDGLLFLGDYSNYRVVVFDGIPDANNASASFVLGQSSLTADDSSELAGPQSVSTSDGKIFIADYDNSQIAIYNSIPTTSVDAPDLIIGASNGCDAQSVDGPYAMDAHDGKMVVADTGNSRILIWNTIPTQSDAAPDIVLGQVDFETSCDSNRGESQSTASTLDGPVGVWTDGEKLVVNDSDNCRTLIWSTFPTENGQAADVVLGQSDFTESTCHDDDQASAQNILYPYYGVVSNGTQLMIGDSSANRVLIWNTFPTENHAPADIVLGQSNFTHYDANDVDQDGEGDAEPSASTFDDPMGLLMVGNQLIVSDRRNHRYLVFDGQ